MTKKYRLILTVFLGFFFLNVSAQEIVGYYPSYRGAARALNVPYDQLTKVLYCFINPNTDGTLQKSPGDALFGWDETTFQTVKSLCKSNGVKIYVSIGGADAGYQRAARLYQVCNDPVTRNTFITSILNFANSEGLDGIDIDWEFPRTNPEKEAHRLLLQELRQRINSSSNPNLKLGIAVGGETLGGANHLQYINPQSFSYVDDIHLMAYDFPAGNPNYDPNHHSSYNDALNCINGYINAGAPAEKLVLGVPFYGRSADRNSTADYNQINTGGGNATAYNSDVYNGWYYNGKATLEAKVDLIQSKGGQGIMIWDLGQDRGYNGDPGYELLKVIKDKMDNSCLAPKPNLGPDVGVCGSTPVTLNSNVNTAAGRTFVWKKDGVIISGATSNTYSTTSGGTYVVEVTQNGCTRSDEIKVIAGQSLSVTGATRCGEGQVTLTVNTAGSGFDWYDAELGGSKVHTGSTYSPTLTSTTTFYVQEASSSTNYNAGKAVIDATKAQKEHYFKFGHKTVVKQDLTIVSMRVWTADPTTFRVVAVDAVDGKTIKYSSADISIPGGQAQVVPVNLTLPTGTYYITPDADNRTPTGGNMWTESATTFAGTDIPNVISIEGQAYMNFGNGFNADPSPGTHYGQLFDWVIATGTPPPCGRTPVTATINPGPTQPGNFTASTATVCQGQTGVVYTVPNDPSVIYEWSYSGSGATFASGQGTNSVTVDFASNATNGNISVVAKKVGCGDSPARTIGVTVNPATTASVSISASETTICQGTSVTFTATPVTGGATPSYQWKLNGGNVGTGGSTFTSSTLNNGDKVSVVMTVSGTCITGSPATSNEVTMTVNPATTASVSISASETTICQGTSVTFTATPVTGGATPSYQWKLNGGNVGTGGSTFTSSTLNNGDKVSVVMTLSGGTCVTGSPATSNEVTMTVNPATTASVSISASETTICPGTAVTFTATPVTGGATPSYQWKLNGGDVGTGGSTFTSSTLNNGDKVSVVMTVSGTCITGSPATSNEVTITVNSATTASVSISASETTICQGTSVTFTATPVTGGATPSYQWKLNGSDVGSGGSTFTSSTLNNGDKVSVVMTVSGSCVTGSPATSNEVTMTVNPATTASVSISASETTICPGTAVTFTATPVTGGATPSYQWKLNGGDVGTGGSTFTSSTLNNGDKVSVVMTLSGGTCVIGSPATSNEVTINVSSSTTASVSISASETTICPGTPVTFTATPVTGGATPSYQWKLNGNDVGTGGSTFTSSTLNNGDKVSVVMTVSGSCVTGSPATSNEVTITVNPAITASVSISASETTICPGTAVTFTATPVAGSATPSYQWKLNGGDVGTGGSTFTSSALNDGDKVSVVMTASGSCVTGSPATSNEITINVNSSTAASVTISASETTICAGSPVTFTATPVGGGASPTYQWKLNGGDVGTGGSTFTSSTLNNGDKVRVVMTSNSTCATGSPATSNEVTITVNNTVNASVNVTATSTSICAGTSVTFTAMPEHGGTTPTYQWKVNGSTVASGATFTTTGLANGDQVSVEMTSNATCVTSATVSSAVTTMSVSPVLAASVQISANATTICSGTLVTFTADPTNGGATPTYQWKLNGNIVGTGATYSNSSLSHGDRISVEMTSSETCVSGSPAQSNEIVMTVDNAQVASVSISTAQTTVCAGVPVTFTATPTHGGTAPTYTWKVNDIEVASSGPSYTTSTLTSGDKVSVVMTSNASCATGSPATSNAITMTVIPSVSATIQISADKNNVCEGTPVIFTASITNGGAAPSYQWKVNGVNMGSNSSVFSSASLNNNDVVTCVLTSDLACATNSPVTSNAVTMAIKPIVAASVSLNASANTICSGESVTFTATPTHGGTAPVYQWKVNDLDIVNTGSTFTSNTLNNGDKVSVVMTSNEECVSGSPATSNSITINVNPSVTASVAITASSSSICTGTTVNFTAVPTHGGSSPVYQWKVNGNIVGNGPNFSSNTLADGDQVSVVMTSNETCVTGSPATSNVVTMSVTSGGTVGVTISTASTSICQGTPVSFTATPVNGGSAPVYQWKVNGAVVGTNSETFTSNTIADGDVVTCQITSNLGCISGSPTATSNALTMSVTQNAPASVSIAADATTICVGTTVTFTATPNNGGSSPVYQWRVNGNTVGGNSATYSSNTLNNGDIVTCVMQSNAQCATGSPATSNAVTITVTTSVAASVNITSSTTTICSGTEVTFTANGQNGGPAPIYQWKVNGVNAGNNGSTFKTSTLTNGSVVSVEMTSSLGCATGSPATSNEITVTVNPVVTAGIQISADETSICKGTSVTFTATANNPGTAPIYQWKVNGVNVSSNSNTFTSSNLNDGDEVVCVLTSNAACVTNSPVTSNNIVMTVNPVVTAAVSISAPTTNICQGDQVTFTANPVNGGANPTYQWRLNGNPVGSGQSTYTTSALSNGDVVSLVMTSSQQCATGSPATSNSLTINVASGGNATLSISTESTEVCMGEQVEFVATSTFGGNSPVYQWKVNGTNVGSNSPVFVTSTLTNGSVVSCVMTSSLACAIGSPVTSNSIAMVVNSSVTTSVSITASKDNICSGETVVFTANGNNGGGAPTYDWRINGVSIGVNTSTYSSSALSNGDEITCVFTSSNSCANNSPAVSNKVKMTVNPRTPQPGPFTEGLSSVRQGQTGVVYTVPFVAGVTYKWMYSGHGVSINGSGNSVTLDFGPDAEKGSLYVSADDGICGESFSRSMFIDVEVVGSVKNASGLVSSLSSYPNPFTDNATITYQLVKNAKVSMTLQNIVGGEKQILIDNELKSEGEYELQVHDLPAGIYIIQLAADDAIATHKMIKIE